MTVEREGEPNEGLQDYFFLSLQRLVSLELIFYGRLSKRLKCMEGTALKVRLESPYGG